MESTFCVNCGSASGSMVLEDEQILHCIQQWSAPLLVQAHDLICTICWTEASQVVQNISEVGRICVFCNTGLPPRTRSHQLIQLRTDTQHHTNIRNIILERLQPLQVRASQYICHPCWQRAERAAKHYSLPSTSRATTGRRNTLRCVNCNIDLIRMRRHILEDNVIFEQVQQQIAPRVVTQSDYICDACHTLFSRRDVTEALQDSTPSVGHLNVCIKCGRSLTNTRSHTVRDEINRHILHIVRNWVQPREIQPLDLICHRCYQRAETLLNEPSASEPVPQHAERIILPNYSRAPDTHSRCIFPACNSDSSQQIVPYMIRVRLFSDHKYYIPRNCRICRFHLETQPWMDLFDDNMNHSFTAAYIEDFCDLLKSDRSPIDFQNIEGMDNNMVHYWIGRTKQQFRDLEAALPEFRNRNVALGAYLMKLRTGDSDDRIATVMNMSRSTLTKLIFKVRDIMMEHFVPQHLELGHILRSQVAEKNLYIPNSLFGNPGNNLEEHTFAIMDGTYIYVQKSANYSYQKNTYSLHKYRNLVKPFIIVCCDGYIIDVLGPYAATKSDADILKDEFRDPLQPLYFREGDVFILDRGFRDSISLLQNLNYSVHYPLSLEPDEHQMSTQNANESRKVTLCRWVVEVVNGRAI